MYNKVEICGVNTSKLKTLSEKATNELLIKAQNGQKSARDELIKSNLKLVLSAIQSFAGRGEAADDLFQVGCIGLIKAIDTFDVSLGYKLSTYAMPMIIGEIRRFLRDSNTVRVSRSVRDLAYKAMQARETLTAQLMSEPTVKQIADSIGEKESAVVLAMDAVAAPVSLYDPIYTDNGDPMYVMDQIKDEHNLSDEYIDKLAINQVLGGLCERERMIVLLRFYATKTQTEVSKEMGISQAQVSRLEKQALSKMKKELL